MRKFAHLLLTSLLGLLLATLLGCVTINVYFPEAAAQKAAGQFIGTVLDADGGAARAPAKSDSNRPVSHHPAVDKPAATPLPGQPSAMLLDLLIPAAEAAETPDIRIQNSTTNLIQQRMQERFRSGLSTSFDSGALGFTRDGMVTLRDASKVPLSQRAEINATLADENNDRVALYREVANANGHPEWEAQIRAAFAQGWIEHAHAGWYYQDAAGNWKRK